MGLFTGFDFIDLLLVAIGLILESFLGSLLTILGAFFDA